MHVAITMIQLTDFIAHEFDLKVQGSTATAIRSGSRAIVEDECKGVTLVRTLANRLPYHYRTVQAIAQDFALGSYALEAAIDIAANAPTSPKFQRSHAGEILAATFVEEHLGFRRLYSKLTLTTSENTNVHKMDGLFVDVAATPYRYLFVEAKSSILPTDATKTKTHRSGILKQMIESLESYKVESPRFELARIRDNLDEFFSADESKQIRRDLMPPGPMNLEILGISITNAETVNSKDDDFILTSSCSQDFDYKAIVVTDLATLAQESYGVWEKLKAVAQDV